MAQSGDRDALNDLRSYASGLVDAAPTFDPEALHLVAGSPVPKRPHRFTVPMLAAMGVVAMLFFAEVGVTVAANSAVPGDGIYGIDLLVEDAFSAIGIPLDTSSERLDEAEVLLARSELSEAIRTARVAFKDMEDGVAGPTVAHLVDAEIALAEGVDPATEERVRTSFGAFLQATRDTGSADLGETQAISSAAARVASAARPDGVPES
jgi:hypothetical protein